MNVQMYPDWYLALCAVVLVITCIGLVVATWRHR